MEKQKAIDLIDMHKNRLVNPVEMLMWTWLRVIILNMPDDQWEAAVAKATEVMSK